MTEGHGTPRADMAFQAVARPGSPTIYLVAENPAVLRHVFEQHNLCVQRSCPMMQFGRRTVSDDATAMLQALKRDGPTLIWIQWSPEARSPKDRPNIRTAVEFLSGLVELQLNGNRMVILEGRACDVPARDEVFENQRRLGQLLGPAESQSWCRLGINNHKGRTVCGDHLVMCSPPWRGGGCICQRQSSTYAYNKGEGYEEFILHALLHFKLLVGIPPKCRDQT